MEISIVVTVYNVQEYIEECLKSILKQSVNNFEVIVVDDGSSDKSRDICDAMQRIDDRLVVIHKKNEGLVAARKTGISNAKNQYIMFVDGDDWIDENCVKNLFETMIEEELDLCVASFYKQFDDKISVEKNSIPSGIYETDKLIKELYTHMIYNPPFYRTGIKSTMCAKLFKRELLDKLYKDMPNEIVNGEDVAMVYPYILESRKIKIIDESVYYYRQNPYSMSQKKYSKKTQVSDALLAKRLNSLIFKYPQEYNLKQQIEYFWAHFILQRDVSLFDTIKGECSFFGNVAKDDKLIVYGAGRFGKQLYYYLSKYRDVTLVDKQASYYRKFGLPVEDINIINIEKNATVLIAIIDSNIAKEVQADIQRKGNDKVRVLDVDRMVSESTLKMIGLYK